MADSGNDQGLNPRILLWGTVALAIGCAVGAIVTIRVNSPGTAAGPLSEWVPGGVTAIALIFTLSQQLEARAAQRRLDAEQTRVAKEQADAKMAGLAADRRALAEKVFVWTEIVADRTFGSRGHCVIRWSNVSDAPAYLVTAHLHLRRGGVVDIDLGSFPPQTRIEEVGTEYSVLDDGVPPVAGVGCTFRDANGVTWTRDPSGRLSEAV